MLGKSCLLWLSRCSSWRMGEVWLVQNADYTMHSVGKRGGQGAEDFLCLNFSCLAMKCEFYFTVENTGDTVLGKGDNPVFLKLSPFSDSVDYMNLSDPNLLHKDPFNFFSCLGLHPWHMEVSWLGVESELQLPDLTTAVTTQNPSHICELLLQLMVSPDP